MAEVYECIEVRFGEYKSRRGVFKRFEAPTRSGSTMDEETKDQAAQNAS